MNLSTNVNFANGAITSLTGLASDELYPTNNDPELLQFHTNSITRDNVTNWALLWKFAYECIYHVNACITGLSASITLNASVKNQLLGEVFFLRAFLYFHLINLYGDVPLALTIDYQHNAILPRKPRTAIYDQIITDLLEAQHLLISTYPSPDKLRPNLHTVTALLSRAYLYTQQWPKAVIEASRIIDASTYFLEPNLNDVFIASNRESIWEMVRLQAPAGTPEGFQFLPASTNSVPKFGITTNLINSFELNDQRKANWVKSNTIGLSTYYYPAKYKVRVNPVALENYVVFRLAEQYLIRAEAEAHQNNINEGLSDLNVIRNRAGLPTFSAADSTTLLTGIIKERQVEFFCEWGHRWFDLKRSNLIDIVLTSLKPDWQNTDALLPIFSSELQANPFLIQNPGY
jgi:hypothetical protein